ncbi:DUF4136 domain-containing protein [Telluribacter humicola]|uniref:DUF4136 domain-containing protein n=1 Tax=Telluribacter humicola TaxID=1720261 RepID=UPI001A977257|nr:DUF4136 domain-containing protein [Telluribacter humicola]
MKELRKVFIVLLAFITTPLLAQNYTVTSDKDLSAPFDQYKSYTWAKSINSAKSLAYAINDAVLHKAIKDAVAHEMAAREFKMSSQSPDLLVNFRVFDKPVEMTGYEGYFRDADYWGTDEVRNGQLGLIRRVNDDDRGRPGTQYYFDKGTILIQLVDAKKGVVVWQGYASGLTDGNVFDKNTDHVAKAINLVFEELDLVLNE